MVGIRNFVLGFSFSLFSVSVCGQLLFPTPSQQNNAPVVSAKIDLFKKNDTFVSPIKDNSIFADVVQQPLAVPSIEIASSAETFSVDGIDDDEILNISTDNNIPIEYNISSSDDTLSSEILDAPDSKEKTAMLPTILDNEENSFSPWLVAKGAPNIKNKKLAEDLSSAQEQNLFTDDFKKMVNSDKAVSYKVAEKIKQSIIFPIPDEILNDENLTPTFINGQRAADTTPSSQNKKSVTPKKKVAIYPHPTETKKSANKQDNTEKGKGFIGSISSWFSEKPSEETVIRTQKKATPSYGSKENKPISASSKPTEDLGSIYESLQNTQKEYHQRKIVPAELRLFFQDGRAEISGSTLRWLKTFSDAVQDDETFLQINLGASTSTELQKKRLNLLYTIFMNNGVDFRKVDTNFTLNEPNAFVIRTIRR